MAEPSPEVAEAMSSMSRSALLRQALGQLVTLDWALLALIPAAELQAVDRALSVDPVDVDKVASTFLEAAASIQSALTELRVRAFDCERKTELKLEILALKQELAASDAALARMEDRVALWKQALGTQRRKLNAALSSV